MRARERLAYEASYEAYQSVQDVLARAARQDRLREQERKRKQYEQAKLDKGWRRYGNEA